MLGMLEGAPETDGCAEGPDDGFALGRVLIDGFASEVCEVCRVSSSCQQIRNRWSRRASSQSYLAAGSGLETKRAGPMGSM